MTASTFTLRDAEGVELFVRRWEPPVGSVKAVAQIAHGVCEHSARYGWTAEKLCAEGYACYADDHRGHGNTAPSCGGLGRLGPGGWDAVVRDLALVTDRIVEDHPGLPIFLVGHSWGSHLSQDYMQRWGARLAGVVLIGSTGAQPFIIAGFGPLLSRLSMALKGPDAPSFLSDDIVFKAYNKPYLPSPTNSKSDWISRDEAEVRAFIADPLCGFSMTTSMALELSLAYRRLWRSENESRIPKSLPVLLLSGSDDSSNARLANLKPLVERYRDRLGLADVVAKYYEGARHSLLCETNKEEVVADLVAWLGEHMDGHR